MISENKRRALVSATNKKNLFQLKKLIDKDWEIISVGKPATEALATLDIPHVRCETMVDSCTMFDESLNTFRSDLLLGILADRANPQHMAMVARHSIGLIDIVAVDECIFGGDDTVSDMMLGDPALVRAAVKNYKSVLPLTTPKSYIDFVQEITQTGDVTFGTRKLIVWAAMRNLLHYERGFLNFLYLELENMHELKDREVAQK